MFSNKCHTFLAPAQGWKQQTCFPQKPLTFSLKLITKLRAGDWLGGIYRSSGMCGSGSPLIGCCSPSPLRRPLRLRLPVSVVTKWMRSWPHAGFPRRGASQPTALFLPVSLHAHVSDMREYCRTHTHTHTLTHRLAHIRTHANKGAYRHCSSMDKVNINQPTLYQQRSTWPCMCRNVSNS